MQIKMEPEAVREQQGKLWNSLVKFDRASCEVGHLPASLCLHLLLMLPLIHGSSGEQAKAWLATSDQAVNMKNHLESSQGVSVCSAVKPALALHADLRVFMLCSWMLCCLHALFAA